ncbi:MAG TPA: hypothetical protein VMA37_01460 [Acetobacteraceae bacterium]|nr:hypothetical protein [Acetobacteraceae bacterium]
MASCPLSRKREIADPRHSADEHRRFCDARHEAAAAFKRWLETALVKGDVEEKTVGTVGLFVGIAKLTGKHP